MWSLAEAEGKRDDDADHLAPVAGDDFDRGIETVRRMTFDEAVAYALSHQT